MAEAQRVLRVLETDPALALGWDVLPLGAERYLEEGTSLTDEEFRSLEEDYDAILLGALGDPRVPGNEHARDILLGLRFRLDLYINYRPCRLLHPSLSPLVDGGDRPMDVHIFRENTEGHYLGGGSVAREGTPHEVAVAQDLNTRRGVERIIRAAFEFARARDLAALTMVDKANAIPGPGRLWRRTLRDVAEEFPEIQAKAMYVDAMAMDLIRNPDLHRVIVTSNLFGDILSDEAAALTGGMGLAPSANLNPGRHALFEPVHGSAPDIAGQGWANPVAAIRCVALLMENLGREDLAQAVEDAVAHVTARGIKTPDLGGEATTSEVGDRVAARLARALDTSGDVIQPRGA